MKRVPILLRGLTWAALIDWLIGRTFTRSAIFMPKSTGMIVVFQTLSVVAQLAATLTSLLALGALIWIAWEEWQTRRKIVLPLALVGCAGFSLFFLFVAPTGGWAILEHGMSLAVITLLTVRLRSATASKQWPLFFIAFTLMISELYQLTPSIYEALHWSGPPAWTTTLFNFGELLAVLSPIGLWWAFRSKDDRRSSYAFALIPTLAVSILHYLDPATTGIMAIWSVGLTLYLPWPIYGLSLWLASVTAITSARRGTAAGWVVLLLAAGGYAPQLSTQAFLGIIALWLIVQHTAEPEPSTVAQLGQSRSGVVRIGA